MHSFIHHIEGIHLPVDFKEFYVESAPAQTAILDIQFADGYTIDQMKIEYYGTKHIFKIIAHYRHVRFVFSGTREHGRSKMRFELEHTNNQFVSVKEELEIYQIQKRLGEGKAFKCFSETGEMVFKVATRRRKSMLEEANGWLQYFKDLQVIQKHFSVVFKNFSKEEPCWGDVRSLARVLDQRKIEVEWKGKWIVAESNSIAFAKLIMSVPDEPYVCMRQGHYNVTYHILGKDFTVDHTELTVIDNMLAAQDEQGRLYVKSADNKATIQFYSSNVNLFPDSMVVNV